MMLSHKVAVQGAAPKSAPIPRLQHLLRLIRDNAIRAARAVDRAHSAFYLPAEARERAKKLKPDKADTLRLHALGVRW